MKHFIILLLLIFYSSLGFSQTDSTIKNDSLINQQIQIIKDELNSVNNHLWHYEKYRELNRSSIIFGSIFAICGTISLVNEASQLQPNFKNTLTIGLFGTSVSCFIASIVFTELSYKHIEQASFQISANVNKLQFLIKF